MDKKKYPIGAEHYTLYEEVGQGVSASVYRALCIPFDEIVAVKILDFERNNSDLVRVLIIRHHVNLHVYAQGRLYVYVSAKGTHSMRS